MLPTIGSDFGRYAILGELGRGGMGVVFRARHHDLDREVALKLMAPSLGGHDAHRRRFLREARALARIDSPYVVRVYDAGEQDGWLFIATELITGGDLSTLLKRNGPLPLARAAGLAAALADGLAQAHDAGILHRDIKPSNILLRARSDGMTEPVMCDFGIAEIADSDSTQTVGAIGTPAYMAPERQDGVDASVASDIYALGCVLWAMVSGRQPYEGNSLQILVGHQRGPIPELGDRSREAAAINRVIAGAMAKQPEQRYASMARFADALRLGPDGAPATRPGDAVEPAASAGMTLTSSTPMGAAADLRPGEADIPTIAPGVPSDALHRGHRMSAGFAALALLVAGLVGAVAFLVIDRADDGTAEDRTADDGTSQSPAAGAPTSSGDTSPVGDRGSDRPAPELTFRCWTGREVADSSQCPTGGPVGLKGLRWVFPDFETVWAPCTRRITDRLLYRRCIVPWTPGPTVELGFSAWPSAVTARAHYTQVSGSTPYRWHGMLRWDYRLDGSTTRRDEPVVKAALVYPDAPWGVTVYANTAKERDAVLSQLEFRPVAELGGEQLR